MLQVRKVNTREEFDAVIDVVWDAMHDPYRQEFHWLHPVHGYTEEDRLASIKEDADRRWQSAMKNPASHWFYVSDHSNPDKTLGIVEWQVYTEKPFPNGPVKLECTWFPRSETRDFVTEFINQLYYPRTNWMNRPFIALNAMAVRPSARGQGIGSLLMEWGIEKAEELDLECWVEATDMGRRLYERFGFRPLMTYACNMYKENPSQTWTALQHRFAPTLVNLLWRPSRRNIEDGCSFWQVMAASVEQSGDAAKSIVGLKDSA